MAFEVIEVRARHWLLASLAVSLLSCGPALAQKKYIYEGHEISQQQFEALNVFNEGYELIVKKDWVGAEKKLAEALRLDPDMYAAQTNYGFVLSRLNRTDEAIKHLERSVELKPNAFEGLSTLAAMYQASGQLDKAIDTYTRALKVGPTHQLAPQMKAVIQQLKEVRDQQAAIAKKVTPGDSQADYFAFATADSVSRWPVSKMPIKVFVPTDESCKGITNWTPDFNAAIHAAFDEWSKASGGSVKFEYVTKASDADIDCMWTDDSTKVRHPSEGGEARVQFDLISGIKHSQIILLTKIPDATDMVPPVSTIKFAAMHEIGHSLGILGHSPDPKDVMYCSLPASVDDWHVTTRDGNTLARIYKQGAVQMANNSSGIDLASSGNFAEAAKKFEDTLKTNPTYEPAKQNLAICLNNMAIAAAQGGKYADAAAQFKRAIDLMQTCKDKTRMVSTLRNYSMVLKMLNRGAEAATYKAQADKLSSDGHVTGMNAK